MHYDEVGTNLGPLPLSSRPASAPAEQSTDDSVHPRFEPIRAGFDADSRSTVLHSGVCFPEPQTLQPPPLKYLGHHVSHGTGRNRRKDVQPGYDLPTDEDHRPEDQR